MRRHRWTTRIGNSGLRPDTTRQPPDGNCRRYTASRGDSSYSSTGRQASRLRCRSHGRTVHTGKWWRGSRDRTRIFTSVTTCSRGSRRVWWDHARTRFSDFGKGVRQIKRLSTICQGTWLIELVLEFSFKKWIWTPLDRVFCMSRASWYTGSLILKLRVRSRHQLNGDSNLR